MPVLDNQRHEKFCQLVAKGSSATQAYKDAGFASSNRSRTNASELRAKTDISTRIKELQMAGAEETVISIREVLEGLKNIAMADIADAFDDDGNLLPIKKIPKHLRLALAGFEVEEIYDRKTKDEIGQTKKIRLEQKTKAWEHLGRYLKLFVDKVEHDVSDELADRLARAIEERKNRSGTDKPNRRLLP